MESTHMATCVLDGQTLLEPDDATWDALMADPVIEGVRFVAAMHQPLLLKLDRKFVGAHPEFRLVLYHDPAFGWMSRLLLETTEGPIRVRTFRAACGRCAREATIANTADAELYSSLPDPDAVFTKTSRVPRVKCPRCQTRFRVDAVWVEPLRADEEPWPAAVPPDPWAEQGPEIRTLTGADYESFIAEHSDVMLMVFDCPGPYRQMEVALAELQSQFEPNIAFAKVALDDVSMAQANARMGALHFPRCIVRFHNGTRADIRYSGPTYAEAKETALAMLHDAGLA